MYCVCAKGEEDLIFCQSTDVFFVKFEMTKLKVVNLLLEIHCKTTLNG